MALSHTLSTSTRQIFLGWIRKHGGFTLIEVMVVLVILSFGLLGVAGLFVKGVSNASASESMAKASLLAAGMADRIRANPAVAITPSNEYIRNYGDPIPTPTTSIALNDVNGWLIALAAALPQGDGTISLDNATPRKVVIGVHWSNCLGTLNDSDQNACKNDSANAFKSVTYELRL